MGRPRLHTDARIRRHADHQRRYAQARAFRRLCRSLGLSEAAAVKAGLRQARRAGR